MENGTVQKGQNLLEDFVWPIDTGRLMGDPVDFRIYEASNNRHSIGQE